MQTCTRIYTYTYPRIDTRDSPWPNFQRYLHFPQNIPNPEVRSSRDFTRVSKRTHVRTRTHSHGYAPIPELVIENRVPTCCDFLSLSLSHYSHMCILTKRLYKHSTDEGSIDGLLEQERSNHLRVFEMTEAVSFYNLLFFFFNMKIYIYILYIFPLVKKLISISFVYKRNNGKFDAYKRLSSTLIMTIEALIQQILQLLNMESFKKTSVKWIACKSVTLSI